MEEIRVGQVWRHRKFTSRRLTVLAARPRGRFSLAPIGQGNRVVLKRSGLRRDYVLERGIYLPLAADVTDTMCGSCRSYMLGDCGAFDVVLPRGIDGKPMRLPECIAAELP